MGGRRISERWKQTILSNRIRIHVSIRIAIVILNSKLPTLFVSVCCVHEYHLLRRNIENYDTAYLKWSCCVWLP